MRYSELKDRIGGQAKQIIISERQLRNRNHYYTCPVTNHSQDDYKCQWYDSSNSFYCHDCGQSYDVIDHAKTKTEPYKYLSELAGIEYKPKKIKAVKPKTKAVSNAGIEWFKTRGITKETLDLYRVRTDEQNIYFNYATPDNILANIKTRPLKEKKFFLEKGAERILYGLHLLKSQSVLAICEGEPDALCLYQIVQETGLQDKILCSSLPCGADSLNEKLVSVCSDWLDMFEEIYIIPDQDEAGKEFTESALELLQDYKLSIINLPCKDVNDYYLNPEYNPCDIFQYKKPLVPELKGVRISSDVVSTPITNGLTSGYITHDHNDNGLKPCRVTVITGKTGDGKTTYARQIPITCAMRGIKSFIFIGESSAELELDNLAALCAEKGEITTHYGLANTIRYVPTEAARQSYKKKFSKYIYLSDPDSLEYTQGHLFKSLLSQMKVLARHHEVKLFILDNLMILCKEQGTKVFTEQKQIVGDLKTFAKQTKTHVILIAHTKKGQGEQDISGAAEIQNYVDTILRYVRFKDDFKKSLIKKYPEISHVIEKASAFVKTEKVRDNGHRRLAWLEWDGQRGALYDLSSLPEAQRYFEKGYWSKPI